MDRVLEIEDGFVVFCCDVVRDLYVVDVMIFDRFVRCQFVCD